jgi:peptidoglycan L-alanyl-D-glutamate endopeptidase CwlK
MYKFGKRSTDKLVGVGESLIGVMTAAITDSPLDFAITCGLRTVEEQKILVATGKSRTMKSKHLTGHAVDIVVFVDGKVTWEFKYYKQVATHIKKTAAKMGIEIVWGGEAWAPTFIDGPHFQVSKLNNEINSLYI